MTWPYAKTLQPRPRRLLGEVILPAIPRSWNVLLSAKARDRMRIRREDKARWAALLLAVGCHLPRDVKRAELHFRCYGNRRRDPDNLYVKPLIDAMRQIGILIEDDSDHIRGVRLEYRQERGQEGRTRLRIYDGAREECRCVAKEVSP